jgi:hypothetical protein
MAEEQDADAVQPPALASFVARLAAVESNWPKLRSGIAALAPQPGLEKLQQNLGSDLLTQLAESNRLIAIDERWTQAIAEQNRGLVEDMSRITGLDESMRMVLDNLAASLGATEFRTALLSQMRKQQKNAASPKAQPVPETVVVEPDGRAKIEGGIDIPLILGFWPFALTLVEQEASRLELARATVLTIAFIIAILLARDIRDRGWTLRDDEPM